MKIPNEALREVIAVEDYSGSNAYGPVFAAARYMKANVQESNRLIIDARGRQVTVNTLIMVRPEKWPIPVESRITWGDAVLRVIRAFPVPHTRSATHVEITAMPWDVQP